MIDTPFKDILRKKISFDKHLLRNIIATVTLLLMFSSCESNHLDIALKLSGPNRKELEKVIEHYKKLNADSLKLKAAYFLIENMPGHYSLDTSRLKEYRPLLSKYDTLIKRQTSYPELISAMDSHWTLLQGSLKSTNLQKESVNLDITSISSAYLIKNIEDAFLSWEHSSLRDSINFNEFCEYILPYRHQKGFSIEEWRPIFSKHLIKIKKSKHPTYQLVIDSLLYEYEAYRHTFRVMPNYPYLKLSDFMISKRADCQVRCWFNSMLFSTVAIPVATDFVPLWGNKNGTHFWNILSKKSKSYPFESFWEEDRWRYKKLYNNISTDPKFGDLRLPKVYRFTYSIDRTSLVFDAEVKQNNIPPFFLDYHHKDVSDEYFKVDNIEINLKNNISKSKYAYLCVFNNNSWKPIQFGEIIGNRTIFKKMGRDIVYMPAYYVNGEVLPAGFPIYLNSNGVAKQLRPNFNATMSINLDKFFPIHPYKELWKERLIKAKIQGSNDRSFRMTKDLHIINDLTSFIPDTVILNIAEKFRFVRLLFKDGNVGGLSELSPLQYVGNRLSKLDGEVIFSKGLAKDAISKVFDNDYNSFLPEQTLDVKNNSKTWIGLDLKKEKKIDAITYCPQTDEDIVRPGWRYELFYWNNEWLSLGVITSTSYKIQFKNVPSGALYLIKNLNVERSYRPFRYNDKMGLVWH